MIYLATQGKRDCLTVQFWTTKTTPTIILLMMMMEMINKESSFNLAFKWQETVNDAQVLPFRLDLILLLLSDLV